MVVGNLNWPRTTLERRNRNEKSAHLRDDARIADQRQLRAAWSRYWRRRAGRRTPNVGPVSPNARVSPNAIGVGHDGVMPNAVTMGKNPKPLTPNGTTDPTAKTVDPTAKTVGPNTITTVPDRVITPDAHTGPGPDQ